MESKRGGKMKRFWQLGRSMLAIERLERRGTSKDMQGGSRGEGSLVEDEKTGSQLIFFFYTH